MVAKSYQKLQQIGEPYLQNGKMYVKVQKGDKVQQVRWYNETEYAKMYPGEKVGESQFGNQKDMLGFQE